MPRNQTGPISPANTLPLASAVTPSPKLAKSLTDLSSIPNIAFQTVL